MPAKDKRLLTEATIPLRGPLLRGKRRPRVALIGRFGAGKSTIFEGASSPVARHEKLAGVGGAYQECVVDVGLDQISLVDLPSIDSLHHLSEHDQVVLMYLLWGDQWPRVAQHETPPGGPDFPAPDVLVQVVDATTLEKDLELSLELGQFGREGVPAVVILVNNDGYTVERAIHGPDEPYNDIAQWDWTALPAAFGAPGAAAMPACLPSAELVLLPFSPRPAQGVKTTGAAPASVLGWMP